ncbi:hypothetical protein BJ165DRAFT_1529870 [Panaeolus papilionaceus]|nr:hypothetical protein BJ165DRAFT_1529870 [Panaeolus papilionaceus]
MPPLPPSLHHTYHPEPHHYRNRIVVTLDKLRIDTCNPVHNHGRERSTQESTFNNDVWYTLEWDVEYMRIWAIPRQPCSIWISCPSLDRHHHHLHRSPRFLSLRACFSAQRVTLVIVNISSAKSALLDVVFGIMTQRFWRGYHKQRVLRDRRLVGSSYQVHFFLASLFHCVIVPQFYILPLFLCVTLSSLPYDTDPRPQYSRSRSRDAKYDLASSSLNLKM